ncbi:MAG: rod shape-determining protein MreC [Gammaproteobacteria bacterium]|nr:rod shape-determining protein MreC [Gammaproteobacteria bacterium]
MFTTPDGTTINPLFLKGPSNLTRLMMGIVFAIVLMTMDHRFNQLEKVRASITVLLSPVQYLVHLPLAGIDWLSDTFSTHKTLLEENQRLNKEWHQLRAQLLKYSALEAENMRLRELLDSSIKIHDRVLIAEVLHVEIDPLKRQIIINKGSRHQAFIGQTIIDALGVVGQVIHVSPLTSTVMLITNPDHAIPVQVARNGIRSIAVGSQEDYRLELPYLATNSDVKNGDLLITSGLGGRFPYGYPVAEVYRVEQDDVATFSNAYARPTARLDRHREVLMVWPDKPDKKPDQPTDKTTKPASQ